MRFRSGDKVWIDAYKRAPGDADLGVPPPEFNEGLRQGVVVRWDPRQSQRYPYVVATGEPYDDHRNWHIFAERELAPDVT